MQKSEWLLTNEEIEEIRNEAGVRRLSSAPEEEKQLRIVSFAQDAKTKRKLVEWIGSLGSYLHEPAAETMAIPSSAWKGLCEELGIRKNGSGERAGKALTPEGCLRGQHCTPCASG
ncbi:MAG: hypothetical protein J7K94_01040 [Dehalococcoidia bacterium]|nr:hypothetical protein [Dehalococcoidia bacterium]